MFCEAEKINESGANSIILKVNEVIMKELKRIKENYKSIENPMILLYRLKNLINVSTTML